MFKKYQQLQSSRIIVNAFCKISSSKNTNNYNPQEFLKLLRKTNQSSKNTNNYNPQESLHPPILLINCSKNTNNYNPQESLKGAFDLMAGSKNTNNYNPQESLFNYLISQPVQKIPTITILKNQNSIRFHKLLVQKIPTITILKNQVFINSC